MNKKIPYLSALVITIAAVGSGVILFGSSNPVKNTFASSNDGLPFTMPSDLTLKSSPKKVYGHYFTPYPIRLGYPGSADLYETLYLNPNGEGDIHLSYGGLLRDKPLYYGTGTAEEIEANRTNLESGLYNDVTNYDYEDMKEEIKRAVSAGLDGFTIDMLSSDQSKNSSGVYNNLNYRRMVALFYAAQWYNSQPEQIASNHATDFKIMLMPDGTAGSTDSVALIESAIVDLNSRFNDVLVHENGKLVVAPFKPENRGVNFWIDLINNLSTNHGTEVTFVPCFLNYNDTVLSQFKDISYGYSAWNTNRSESTLQILADKARDHGKLWMQSHAYQDIRPRNSLYQEANNTEVLRESWDAANTQADWVQLVTWNDYSENTQFTASESVGYNLLDLTAYYVARYKTGSYPTLTKDNLFIIHRLHNNAQNPNGTVAGYTDFMQPWDTSRTPRDSVEILTFAKEASVLNVDVGGNPYSFNVPAGEHSTLVPLAEGTISAELVRSSSVAASVTSPKQVNNNFSIQDLNYHISSAYREGVINTVQAQEPDLVVNSISWSPASPKVGDQIVFSAEIENIGQASTPSGIKHGVSFWINDTVSVSWSDNSTAALAPGEKRVVTANGGADGDNHWIPDDGGNYSIEARVDDVNRITESNENNQRYSTTITVDTLNSKQGDINNDNLVDIVDLSILLSNWNTNNASSDINNDGTVDIVDLSILLSNWES